MAFNFIRAILCLIFMPETNGNLKRYVYMWNPNSRRPEFLESPSGPPVIPVGRMHDFYQRGFAAIKLHGETLAILEAQRPETADGFAILSSSYDGNEGRTHLRIQYCRK